MSDSPGRPARAWQRMLSGRRLDLLAPSPNDIEIDDIAHGLARVARWNGQTVGAHAFSVAQHCCVVTDIVAASHRDFGIESLRAALLHDAPEYVVGDLISPFKSALSLDYRAFEKRLLTAIHDRFDIGELAPEIAAAIKSADQTAAYYEATVLAGFSTAEADEVFGRPNVADSIAAMLNALSPWSARIAEMRFLQRFEELRAA